MKENKRAIELALELFGAVPQGDPQPVDQENTLQYGVIVDDKAAYAVGHIVNYFRKNTLNAEQLNATFHKSWEVISKSSRVELLIHQLLHYLTTYGTNFTSDYVYYPAEKLEIRIVPNCASFI